MHAYGQSTLPGTPLVLPPAIPDHELLYLIGRGAYGEVWLARNAVGTLRAVKIVHRQSFQRAEHFDREFKGLLKFEPLSRSQDGLVDVLQIGRREDAGYFFYVMELADAARLAATETRTSEVENSSVPCPAPEPVSQSSLDAYTPRTLRSELHQSGSLPVTECVTIGIKLASALQHLHGNGLVHRDIKPSNIIFVKGEPKLADIGLVTAIDDAHSLVGTAGYIPPEGPGTPQADLYSLGKVLYEIAFGKDRQDFPQLPPDLQTHTEYAALLELNEIILKACETDPRRRYASAEDLGRDLALLRDGKSITQARLRTQRWKVIKQASLAALAVGLLITGLVFAKRAKSGYTPNAKAAEHYKWGQWHYNQLTPDHHAKALDYLSQAVQADPGFLEPYGEWTALYIWGLLPGFPSEESRRLKVKEIADVVLAIDSNSAEGHAALSLYNYLGRDWRGAEAEIVRAIELNPNLGIPHQFYAFYLTMLGRTEEARRESRLADELASPAATRISAIVSAWPFMADRRYDLAIAQLKRGLELERNFPLGRTFLGICYEAQSNYLEAIEVWRTSDLSTHTNYTKVNAVYDALRDAFNTRGKEGYLRKWIELTEAEKASAEDEKIFAEVDLAGVYAQLGEKEKALDILEKYDVWHRLKFDSLYDPLHDHPRFKALLKRAGLEE